jgi:signal peptidase I
MPYFLFDMDKVKSIIKEISSYVIIIIIVLLIKTFLVSPILVSGDSMDSTLLDGDLMILNKIVYRTSKIERFDIIVIKYNDKYIIKRVIGLPGDNVKCVDNNLYINDKIYVESYLDEGTKTDDFEIENIEENHYFVLGDNREVSLDSRRIGLIDEKDIEGKAIFTIFPFNRWGNKQ